MPIERLTDARLRGLTYEDGEIIDAKSALIARADKTGTVTLTTRYRFGKKRPRIFLGTYPLMGLVAGRDAANRVQEQVRSGLDPQAERHAKREASQLSFDELSEISSSATPNGRSRLGASISATSVLMSLRSGANDRPPQFSARILTSCCLASPGAPRSAPTEPRRSCRNCSAGRSTAACSKAIRC